MQNKHWWKGLLAFLITFGVLAMAASVVRALAVYQHFYALGMQTDDPAVAAEASRELARLDRLYMPAFLLVATAASALVAGVLAWRRPRLEERRAETR